MSTLIVALNAIVFVFVLLAFQINNFRTAMIKLGLVIMIAANVLILVNRVPSWKQISRSARNAYASAKGAL